MLVKVTQLDIIIKIFQFLIFISIFFTIFLPVYLYIYITNMCTLNKSTDNSSFEFTLRKFTAFPWRRLTIYQLKIRTNFVFNYSPWRILNIIQFIMYVYLSRQHRKSLGLHANWIVAHIKMIDLTPNRIPLVPNLSANYNYNPNLD